MSMPGRVSSRPGVNILVQAAQTLEGNGDAGVRVNGHNNSSNRNSWSGMNKGVSSGKYHNNRKDRPPASELSGQNLVRNGFNSGTKWRRASGPGKNKSSTAEGFNAEKSHRITGREAASSGFRSLNSLKDPYNSSSPECMMNESSPDNLEEDETRSYDTKKRHHRSLRKHERGLHGGGSNHKTNTNNSSKYNGHQHINGSEKGGVLHVNYLRNGGSAGSQTKIRRNGHKPTHNGHAKEVPACDASEILAKEATIVPISHNGHGKVHQIFFQKINPLPLLAARPSENVFFGLNSR
eukprot:jgi/Bigna1/79982/fgenesh1_pg.66_\